VCDDTGLVPAEVFLVPIVEADPVGALLAAGEFADANRFITAWRSSMEDEGELTERR